MRAKKKKKVSTTCNAAWKNKGHQRGSVTKVTHSVRSIHLLQATAIKYLQVWLVLCPQSREHTNRQVFFKFNPMPTSYWRTQRLLWPCYSSNLMQHPHLASHCVRSYKLTELPVLHCVERYFFPPLSLFLAILSTSLRRPQKRVAERTTDCSKVEAIVSQPLCAGNSFGFPPKYFSSKQWRAFASVSHHRRDASWPRAWAGPGHAHIQLHMWVTLLRHTTFIWKHKQIAAYFALNQRYSISLLLHVSGHEAMHNSQTNTIQICIHVQITNHKQLPFSFLMPKELSHPSSLSCWCTELFKKWA